MRIGHDLPPDEMQLEAAVYEVLLAQRVISRRQDDAALERTVRDFEPPDSHRPEGVARLAFRLHHKLRAFHPQGDGFGGNTR
jgi:hypothetical protein